MDDEHKAGSAMDNEAVVREQLSAWLDGETQEVGRGASLDALLDYALSDPGRQSCQAYQAIGDVLRQSRPRAVQDGLLLQRLRTQLAEEPSPALRLRQAALQQVAPQHAHEDRAANAAVWRWRAVAGVASVVAVSTLAWNLLGSAEPAGQGRQLASSTLSMPALVMATAGSSALPADPVMIRDPRLDELMAGYRQYGSTTALQMPARFLRNASMGVPAAPPRRDAPVAAQK
ncbi:hypothetical protein GCM10022279_14000 [Comamonas faecalis]|uniref:Anti sigma-E protein RseA N-terminal domain-containing protein n=2 Tax=Comamonas faecalis TaxID=1387849 RepID=A0ABP7R399_9BURK